MTLATLVAQSIKAALRAFTAFLPTSLPATAPEFEKWSREVLEIGGYPVNDSFRQTLAQMLQRVAAERTHAPKRMFLKALRCALITQNSYYEIQAIKERAKKNEEAKQETAESVVL